MVSPALERLPLLPGAAAKGQEGPSRTWKMRPAAAGECNPPPEGGGKGGPRHGGVAPSAFLGPATRSQSGGRYEEGLLFGDQGCAKRIQPRREWAEVSSALPPVPACPLRVQGEEKGGTSDCDALPGRQAVAERS